jgi:hypothetical protein
LSPPSLARSLVFALLAYSLAQTLHAASPGDSEEEIAYLLEFVASSNCLFIRNGSSHEPVDAADHLRLKYRRGKQYAGSAEEFIDRLASESSWTGQAYTVECAGRSETSRQWLYRALEQYRQQAVPAQAR